jgi:hypothetical protein
MENAEYEGCQTYSILCCGHNRSVRRWEHRVFDERIDGRYIDEHVD